MDRHHNCDRRRCRTRLPHQLAHQTLTPEKQHHALLRPAPNHHPHTAGLNNRPTHHRPHNHPPHTPPTTSQQPSPPRPRASSSPPEPPSDYGNLPAQPTPYKVSRCHGTPKPSTTPQSTKTFRVPIPVCFTVQNDRVPLVLRRVSRVVARVSAEFVGPFVQSENWSCRSDGACTFPRRNRDRTRINSLRHVYCRFDIGISCGNYDPVWIITRGSRFHSFCCRFTRALAAGSLREFWRTTT